MKLELLSLILLINTVHSQPAARLDCIPKSFKENSFVCVCNSTYCDTIEQVDRDQADTQFQEYVTSRNKYRLDKFKHSFQNKASPDSDIHLAINRSVKFQTVKGFGGAITDAAGTNIYSLSPEAVKNLIFSYFGVTGIEYNVIRVPIGGTDFSTRAYSYADETPNDFDLQNFTLQMEDLKWKIPFVQAAIGASNKKISLFASPWSAPKWMKTNNDFKGNGTLIGPEGGKYYQTWANYYLKFFQAYQEYGLNFWALTAQNEPTDGYLYGFTFNCMGFTPESQANFITNNLGPVLKSNGFPDIKIMILDDQRLFLPSWAKNVLDYSPETTNNFDGIAVHWYLDMYVNPNLLDHTHELMPDKWIFGSEACAGAGPFSKHVILGGFDRAEQYAKYIIQDLNHWVTGWTDWNLALDINGGPNWANNFVDSPVLVSSATDEFFKQPMFYAMGHFSKFIAEGAVKIELSLLDSKALNKNNLDYVAFYNQETRQTVVVLLNEHETEVKLAMFDSELNKFVNVVCEPHSIRTLVWFD